ncbi:class I SAM-dependent methyltransferase [Paraburkholderia fungorum]|uniref:2-polyprenyl-3-methyl-5-hydroxy-6-metoxy-1, 4-benzoquinol methylase n=1 Tax=Paraburkholderia fungorum TaxID=134537 RepID=A0AAW3V815_9BURK|nr:class I SAM-dependent methyltransferase [Paraburkholderia fungorum]MBB4517823.1 2-polyprenyl-3-methyl-5-hydroxy-6-metoxy-1,4-benzoquinol methylase [Paraburkholderia fungorum]MBB6205792.1 2-polyprenyl-3-methyl-5-hydroxy-6-metoxy-1,4-benzoquinol methylase [Paraburkholderia fungorum]
MLIPTTYESWIDALHQQRLNDFLGREIYEELENTAKVSEAALFEALRKKPVDVVGALLMHIPEQYAALRQYLPTMASVEVQKHWTGAYGVPLLLQSCAFVRAIREGFHLYTGRPLNGLPVLDYGCGWGRLLRLMLAVTGPENLYGCDPWHKSLEACDGDRIRANIALSNYLPTDLPFPGKKFSLIYAFSVFTHLSERAASAALSACRKHIVNDGLMAITVRPPSYWDNDPLVVKAGKSEALKREHALKGFAFYPHEREAVDGDITYGDASISVEFINQHGGGWEVVGSDRMLPDVMQTVLFLKPH